MKRMFTKMVLGALLWSAAFAASAAMTAVHDDELSRVHGQDGVSIAANLDVRVGSFTYTDGDATGGSRTAEGIRVWGFLAATIDIVNQATFNTALAALGVSNGATSFFTGSDVVKIAFPDVALTNAGLLNLSVAANRMGNSSASFGAHEITGINLSGTALWLWAH